MIVPSGAPIWTRTASMESYGGSANKRDYGGIGAVNARTDVTASHLCRLAADMAAMAITAPLFWMEVLSTAGRFDVLRCRTLWGCNTNVPYTGTAPGTLPSTGWDNFPGAIHVPDGGSYRLRIILPISVQDAFGVTGTISVFAAASDTQSLYSVDPATNQVEFSWMTGTNTTAIIRGF